MLKKLLTVIIVFGLINSAVYAVTLEEAVDRTAKRLFIETEVDKNVLRLYKDWGYVDKKYRDTMAGALHAGMLCPNGRMLNPSSNDLTPLFKGFFRFGMLNQTFDVVGFQGKSDIQTNHETLYIINNEILTEYELDDSVKYYAVVNRNNRAYIVWKSTPSVKPNRLYRGRLFLYDDGKCIITNAEKVSFNTWSDISESKYTNVVLGSDVFVTKNKRKLDDVNINHLDSEVYIIGEFFDGEIKAEYFEVK